MSKIISVFTKEKLLEAKRILDERAAQCSFCTALAVYGASGPYKTYGQSCDQHKDKLQAYIDMLWRKVDEAGASND